MRFLFEKIKKMPLAARASLAYIFANLLVKGLGIFTIPIFTRLLSTEEMGLTTTFFSWQSLIGVIAGLALCSGSFAAAMSDFEKKRDEYVASILTLSTLSSAILLLIYVVSHNFWNRCLEMTSPLMAFMLVGFIFCPATEYWLARQRYEYKYKSVAVVSFLIAFISAVVSVLFVILGERYGLENLGALRIYGFSLVTIFFGLFFFISLQKKNDFRISFKYWKYALKVNIPLVFHSLSKLVLDVSDRVMISKMVGNSAVGVYGVLYNLSALSLIVWSAINNSIVPYIFEKLKVGKEEEPKIAKMVLFLVVGYGIVAFTMTMMAPEVIHALATEEYYEAIYIMPPIAAGIFFTTLYNLFGNVLIFHKKTFFVMYSSAIAAVANVILNALFIPRFGFVAAAYTTLISFVVLSFVQWLFMLKVHGRDPYKSKYLWLISFVVTMSCMGCVYLYNCTLIRYMILLISFVFFVLKRNKFLKILKR